MSVIRRRLGCGAFVFLLSLGVGLEHSGLLAAGESAQEGLPQGLVRVRFRHKLPGVFQGGRIIPQATVVEVNEYSGMVIDARGYIVSYVGSSWVDMGNVIPEISVRYAGGEVVPAQLVGVDERVSIAVLRTEKAAARPAVLGTVAERDAVRLAFWKEPELAELQHPLERGISVRSSGDLDQAGNWSFSEGRVIGSAPTGTDNSALLKIQTEGGPSAPVPDRWDGAVLLDEAGRFLGFVSRAESSGLSRAIRAAHLLPVQAARDAVKDVVSRNGDVRAGWLGIFMDDEPGQVRVQRVLPGEPADRAGMREGDVVLRFNETAIWSRDQFVRLLRASSPDSQVEITVERDGQPEKLSTVLGSWHPEERQRFGWAIQIPQVWTSANGSSAEAREVRFYKVPLDAPANLGLVVDSLTPQLAEYFKVPSGKGLLVKSVVDGSPAGRFGFRAGDVLTRVNGEDVESPSDVRRIIELSRDGLLVITYYRDGVKLTRKVALN